VLISSPHPLFLLQTLVHAGFCMFPLLWLADRDCRIFIVPAWCSEYVHTLDLSLSSHPKDASHQLQVIQASHNNSKLLVPDGAQNPNLLHWRRTCYRYATGSQWTTKGEDWFSGHCWHGDLGLYGGGTWTSGQRGALVCRGSQFVTSSGSVSLKKKMNKRTLPNL
jgi:hypothetical protein